MNQIRSRRMAHETTPLRFRTLSYFHETRSQPQQSQSPPSQMNDGETDSDIESESTTTTVAVNSHNLHQYHPSLSNLQKSDEFLNKLYNYMKISEMDKYGISVFEKVFAKYLPFMNETDFSTLVTSYWCNDSHFNCMIKYRGSLIKDNQRLRLVIGDSLMDRAMQSGASVGKIRSMLQQRRRDTQNARNSRQHERDFFIRNCRLRFWNHEVLVHAYIQNGRLTPALAQVAINKFASNIYDNTMSSVEHRPLAFSDHFLLEFFGSQFSTDSIPKMYAKKQQQLCKKKKKQIKKKRPNQNSTSNKKSAEEEEGLEKSFNEQTLRRWCEFLELLTSREAKISRTRFKLLPLTYAVQLGTNTWTLISSSLDTKNELLMSSVSLTLPSDLWNTIIDLL